MPVQILVEFGMLVNEHGDVIRVRMLREGPHVLDYLAQYEALIEGEYRPVTRYDGRHGRPHCDVLDWNGQTIDKIWAPAGTTNNQAFTQAIRDIRENWKQHRNAFQERRRWM